ncbi:MAG: hypothetical protein ACTSRE_15120 [Promethearchaeota archaeon]
MIEHKEEKYKVFIEGKPVLIMDIPIEKKQLLRDHLTIFQGLSQKKNLSAKDIHELYWEPTEQKYSKSMKTIYRYLDLLEDSKLIKISGHRKPIDSHMTEKLYCRTALLFYSKEPVKWWELPKYKKQFEKKEDFFTKLKNINPKNKSELRQLIYSYTEARDKYINTQLKHLENNPELVEILSDLSIMEIKSIITDIANFEIFLNEPELIERFKKLK